MNTKKTILICILLTIIACICQAMEIKDLKLIKKIKLDNCIESIQPCKLSDTVLKKYAGQSDLSPDDIFFITTIKQRSILVDYILFDTKNEKELLRIPADEPLKQLEKEPAMKKLTHTKLEEKRGKLYLNYYLISEHNKNIILTVYPYDIENKKFVAEEICQPQKNYYLRISPHYDFDYQNAPTIIHDDYTASIDEDRNLHIRHITGDKVKIPIKTCQNKIFASPNKKSRYILVHTREKNDDFSPAYINKLTLYDNQTGKPAMIHGKEVDLTPLLRHENPAQEKKFGGTVFGQNDNFIIFAFENEIILFNLNLSIPTVKYNVYQAKMAQSPDNKKIIIISDSSLYILENPFKKIDTDHSERVDFIRNPKYIKEKKIDICKINFGGLQDPILTLKILLLL